MNKLVELRHYARAFCPKVTHANALGEARKWMESGTPVDEAIRLANLGFGADEAGEPEMRKLINQMLAAGTLVPPSQVRIEEDPDDPYHTTLTILRD